MTSRLVRLPPDQQASKFFVFGSTCVTRCNFLGAQLKIFRSTASNTGSKYIPKQMLMLKKSVYPGFFCTIWALTLLNSRGIEYMYNEYNKRISLVMDLPFHSLQCLSSLSLLLVVCLNFEILFTRGTSEVP